MKFLKCIKEVQFHGSNRITDRNARWLFVPTLLLLFGVSVYIVWGVVTRYQHSPTYVVQVESLHPITAFPSVTICPEVSFSEDKMDKFVSELNFSSVNATYFRSVLDQLAAFYSLDKSYQIRDLEAIESVLDMNGITVEEAGRKLTASCEEILLKCRWNDIKYRCSELFRMEITADGFCCIFNGRSLKRSKEVDGDMYMLVAKPHFRELKDNGVALKRKPDAWMTARFGFSSGLIVAIDQSQPPRARSNIDLSYKWVAMQASQQFVDISVNGSALSPGAEQWIAYFTRPTHIAEVAKTLSVDLRGCRMIDEALTYFPYYSRRYCVLECQIAQTLQRCQCVHTVHPQPQGTSRCRARSLMCANHAKVSADSKSCECPVTCNGEEAFVKMTSFKLIPNSYATNDFYSGLDFNKVTVIRAFVQRRFKKTMERWSYFGQVQLFSQLGGIFNMFFSCSVITGLSVLHYCCRSLLSRH